MILAALDRATFSTVIEILALTGFFYAVLRFLRSTRGFGVLRGLAVVVVGASLLFSVLSFWPGVPVLGHLLAQVAPWLVIILFILFQQEVRQGISRFGRGKWFRLLASPAASSETIAVICNAAQRMAKERIGALIAFQREISLGPWQENAVQIDAPVSAILLETIFFPGSPLHDGAVVIHDDTVQAAACLLPLADAGMGLGRLGTRHRAALGLSQETDSVTLVVSEETGKISLCAGGEMYRALSPEKLEETLRELLLPAEPQPAEEPKETVLEPSGDTVA